MSWALKHRRHSRTSSAWGLGVALCLSIFATPVALTASAAPAHAQAPGMFGAGDTDTISVKATVKAVDLSTRTVTLVGPSGETKTLKVGPAVQNLPQVKPGDIVVAHYVDSIAYVVAPAGTKTPEDMLALAAARAVPGQLPAGAVEGKVVLTGLVVGVNPAAHSISLVNPDGGEIRTLDVKNPEYQSMLASIKVGDQITAVISEAVAVAVEPAK